jgi:hypothetical protein
LLAACVVIAIIGWTEPASAETVQLHGELGHRIEHAIERHLSPPLDDVDFLLSDVGFQYQRRFTDYSGDISGRYLGAMATLDELCHIDAQVLHRLAERLPTFQKPDGHFGADQDLASSITQDTDMKLLWGNGRLLMGMVEYGEAYANTPHQHRASNVLMAAKKLGDYYVETDQYYNDPANFRTVGGSYASGFATCYLSAIDGLVGLAKVTGEEKYMRQAERIAELLREAPEFAGFHSHGRLTALRGALDLDRLLGKPVYRDVAVKAHDDIVAAYLFPTDGVGELFEVNYKRDEGCSEADWIRVNIALWRATGSTSYLDMAESVLWNHLLATQFSNGGFGHTEMRSTERGVVGFESKGAEAYWCCSMHGARALADYAGSIVASDGSSIYVNFFEPSRSETSVQDTKVIIALREAGSDGYMLEVEPAAAVTFALNIRVPRWATGMHVSGEESSRVDGYVQIKKEWTGSPQTLTIEMPRRVLMRDKAGKLIAVNAGQSAKDVRLYYGRHLLALPDWYAGGRRESATLHLPVSNGGIVLIPVQDEVGGFPVVVEAASGMRSARLIPIHERPRCGCTVQFDVVQDTADEFAEIALKAPGFLMEHLPVVEFQISCDGNCELFLNGQAVTSHSGWHESVYVYDRGRWGSNVVGVRASGRGFIGTVRVRDDVHVTGAAGWTWRPASASDERRIVWEESDDESAQTWRPVTDLGEWNAAPWYRYSAGFAGTGAHWIWSGRNAADEPVLLRYVFDVTRE